MVSQKLVKIAKNEILKSKNLCSDYLNKFLTDYTLAKNTGCFLNINLDACQYQAKLQLKSDGVLIWNYKTNNFNLKK